MARDLPIKVDDAGNVLAAGDFNAQNSELESIITSADIALDPAGGPDTDLTMLAKAVAAYANAGSTYQDSGIADAYVLSLASNLKAPVKYYNNMTVIFKAGNSNTGPSTINANSLGVKSLTKPDGSALDADNITSGKYITAVYNLASTRFEVASVSETANITTAFWHTHNGYGSTNTTILRLATEAVASNNIVVSAVDSATNGFSITAIVRCKISVLHSIQFNSTSLMGMSINSTQLTTSIATINTVDRLGVAQTSGANIPISMTLSEYILEIGDVVRMHTSAAPAGSRPADTMVHLTATEL